MEEKKLSERTPSRSRESGELELLPFMACEVCDHFWAPRLRRNREITIPFAFEMCERTGRIANFEVAAGRRAGVHQGKRYNDSDVFKGVEAAAHSLARHPDAELERYLEELIEKIAAAQEEDGYLYTARTCDPSRAPRYAGAQRWSYLAMSHELYSAGHLYEAAVAHYRASGRRALLDVALRNADLIDSLFGPGKRRDVPGHQEIELALVKLFEVSGERRYLDLAHFFLEERGHPRGRRLYGRYFQDHAPVREQGEAVGHAVRALYMFSAMTDVARLRDDAHLRAALERLWENLVRHKLSLSGGVGARRGNEGFAREDLLPNEKAYNETCAAIALALWNQRMFLLDGDGRYIDLFERVLYNGLISGISLSGDRFFYANPLASDGRFAFNYGATSRQPWFECSCCPQNLARFLASFPGCAYAWRGDVLFLNLFLEGVATVPMEAARLQLRQSTRYPWDGKIAVEVSTDREVELELRVRIPGWARGRPVAGDLYRYEDGGAGEPVRMTIDGAPLDPPIERGYARIRRRWCGGELLEIDLPMPVRRVRAHSRVAADRGRVALERGPLLYCLEGIDHGGRIRDLYLPDDAPLRARWRADLLGGTMVIEGEARALRREQDECAVLASPRELLAVPYHLWSNRGVGEMAVWIAAEPERAQPSAFPTLAARAKASTSFRRRGEEAGLDLCALNDQAVPSSSRDRSVARWHWWPHRGTREWVQYDFPEDCSVRAVEVYWFVDTRAGGCRPPQSWRVLCRQGQTWIEVARGGEEQVREDVYNRVAFEPRTCAGLRLEAQLRANYSAGLLEWRVR